MQSMGPDWGRALVNALENQNLLISRMQETTSNNNGGASLGDGEGPLRGARERESWQKRIVNEGDEIADAWFAELRADLTCEPGEPLTPLLYGRACLADHWKGHSTLHRTWVVLDSIWRPLNAKPPRIGEARARLAQAFKAYGRATRNGGSWAGAWELTYLPELNEVGSGITASEDASVARWIREKSALAKALDETRKNEKL